MPTVPYGTPREHRPQVDEVFLAAAAADLHDAGMLFEPPKAAYSVDQPLKAEDARSKP